MKITRHKSSKTYLVLASIIAIVAVASLGGYFLWQRMNAPTVQPPNATPTNTVDYNPPTEEQQKVQDAQKNDILNREETPGPSTALSISVTRAGQNGTGQPINVRTLVSGATTGSCDFTFSQSGQPNVTKTFNVTLDVSSSVCNGDLDANAFTNSGKWNLSVVVKRGSETSAPAFWNDIIVNK